MKKKTFANEKQDVRYVLHPIGWRTRASNETAGISLSHLFFDDVLFTPSYVV